MKTIRNLLPLLVAAGAPGVALLAINNVIPADIALAIIAVGGIAAFAAFDYSRNMKSLRVPGRVLRPALPVATAVATACNVNVRRAA